MRLWGQVLRKYLRGTQGRLDYTSSIGLRVPAKVVSHLDDRHVELEYYRDGVRVVNHRCHIDSISFGIPSLDSPPPSPTRSPPPPAEAAPEAPPIVSPGLCNVLCRERLRSNAVYLGDFPR